ncbi:MAG TPA: RNase adapter RapZ [Myxococcota bacterium]|nr:RNase adapter RapZ [Myxococcota bacterium]
MPFESSNHVMPVLQEVVVVSGRSGAGKSTASRALEDMGYFVVDNLPPQLLDDLLSVTTQAKDGIRKIAVIIDVRKTEFLAHLPSKWQGLDDAKYIKKLIFLDASDQQLIDRYQETKRRHPLDDGCGIRSALLREEEILLPIKKLATKQLNTDNLNSHALRNVIKKEIIGEGQHCVNLTLLSFGFKYGVPRELDLCFDVRFLVNPYYNQELRPKTGLDLEVYDYVMSLPPAEKFIEKVHDLIEYLYPLYQEEGKSNLTIAIGCTGGQHRSVCVVEALNNRLSDKFDRTRVEHRDLNRQI